MNYDLCPSCFNINDGFDILSCVILKLFGEFVFIIYLVVYWLMFGWFRLEICKLICLSKKVNGNLEGNVRRLYKSTKVISMRYFLIKKKKHFLFKNNFRERNRILRRWKCHKHWIHVLKESPKSYVEIKPATRHIRVCTLYKFIRM